MASALCGRHERFLFFLSLFLLTKRLSPCDTISSSPLLPWGDGVMYSVSYTHYNFWRESRVRTLKKKVWLALYRERLECVISAWSSDLRNIREGMIRVSKARLIVMEDGESSQISFRCISLGAARERRLLRLPRKN